MSQQYIPPRYRLHAFLKKGGIIAYPTEFCYGLGCLPKHAKAVKHLLSLKKRAQHKGLIVIGQNSQQLQSLLQPLPEHTLYSLNQIWPAPITFILPAQANILPQLRGKNRQNLAVRVPQHRFARLLCKIAQTPLISTSCNQAKRRPCKTEREAKRLFGHQVWVLGGRTKGNKHPSSIIDWSSGNHLR